MTGVEISVAEAESLWGLDKAQQKRARSPGRQGGRVVGGACSQTLGRGRGISLAGAAHCGPRGRTAPPGQGFLRQQDPSLGQSGPRTGRPLEAGRQAERLMRL